VVALVRTQKFSEKAKAPPTLIENRELGLFFMERGNYCAINGARVTSQGVNCWV
jgi:hypothetical protein